MEHLTAFTEGVYVHTTRSITVTVEPEYLDDQSFPEEHRFVWAYHVRIENQGTQTVQLKSRYWRITDELGHVHEVTGEGVIGEQPVLGPGESFEYSSGTPLGTASGIMQGHYVMETIGAGTGSAQTGSGERFSATIPVFSLDSPSYGRLVH